MLFRGLKKKIWDVNNKEQNNYENFKRNNNSRSEI